MSEALGLSVSDAATDDERVVDYLTNHEMLVILDNCEHLLDAVAAIVEAVLAHGGASHLIATSREPLGIIGEQVYVVPPMTAETDAVSLFVERAAESRAGFTRDEHNEIAILELVRRLDGIPLAIELAAASARHLTPAQIVERLDDRFRLLTGGRRRVQRHQTLTATLDWSHDLLSDDERCALRRLAAFPATFSLEGAEYVVDRPDTFDCLASLVDKSLVNAITAGDRMQYRLPESVRLYVEPKLVEADESFECRERHRDWVVQWLDGIPLEERWFGDRDLLGFEQANVRAAIDWSTAHSNYESLARLASGVDWARSEAWREGRDRCLDINAAGEITTALDLQVAMMLWWLGPISADGIYALNGDPGSASATGFTSGQNSAESVAQATFEHPLQALALAGHGRDLTIQAVMLDDAALVERIEQLVRAGVERSQRESDGWRKIVHLAAGMAYASLRRLSEADDAFTSGLDISPGHAPFELLHGAIEGYLAITRLVLGAVDDAVRLARAADSRTSAALTSSAYPYWLHSPGFVLPVALGETGDHAAAHQALIEYHAVQRRTDFRDGLKSVAIVGGALAAQRHDWEAAARLVAAGASTISRTPADYLVYLHYRDRIRAELPSDDAHRLRAEGRSLPIQEAVELALSSPR
jgi:predicted ATPase